MFFDSQCTNGQILPANFSTRQHSTENSITRMTDTVLCTTILLQFVSKETDCYD